MAIETALTLRLIVHLPLCQSEGFLTSLFGETGIELPAPAHTTLFRRGQHRMLRVREFLRAKVCIPSSIAPASQLLGGGSGQLRNMEDAARGSRGSSI